MSEFSNGQVVETDVVKDRWGNGDTKEIITPNGFRMHFTPGYDGAPAVPALPRDQALVELEKRRAEDSRLNAIRLCAMDNNHSLMY